MFLSTFLARSRMPGSASCATRQSSPANCSGSTPWLFTRPRYTFLITARFTRPSSSSKRRPSAENACGVTSSGFARATRRMHDPATRRSVALSARGTPASFPISPPWRMVSMKAPSTLSRMPGASGPAWMRRVARSFRPCARASVAMLLSLFLPAALGHAVCSSFFSTNPWIASRSPITSSGAAFAISRSTRSTAGSLGPSVKFRVHESTSLSNCVCPSATMVRAACLATVHDDCAQFASRPASSLRFL
mmetsp:Transcript_16361/g.39546  ORF Transcript_16361/g.39546 Transcript_16361/m.39546 type:complete len:249 (+) Transcript_16361:1756-2502(+)